MSDELLSPFSGSGGYAVSGSLSPSEITSRLNSGSKTSEQRLLSADSEAHAGYYGDSKERGDIWVSPDRKTVEWYVDDQCIRRFHYDHEVIKVNFVDFAASNDCLVTILEDVAHVYYISKGDSTTVCFPYPVSNAFWCAQGIVLERKLSSELSIGELSDNELKHRFITLSDPMAPFGYLDFSIGGKGYTSLRNMTMLAFPRDENNHVAVLFDKSELKLHFYYTQFMSSGGSTSKTEISSNSYSQDNKRDISENGGSSINNRNLRKISILNRRAASLNISQDVNETPMLAATKKKMQDSQLSSQAPAHSSRRSISATLDRMSGAKSMMAASPSMDIPSSSAHQVSQISQTQLQGQQSDQHQIECLNQAITSKGDISLTEISSMTLPHRAANDVSIVLKCIPLRFHNQEAIVIFDPSTHFSKVWLIDLIPEVINSVSFKVYGNSPPDLIRLSSLNVDGLIADVLTYQSPDLPGTLALIRSSPQSICLYNPFINLESPKHILTAKICFISSKRMVSNKFEAHDSSSSISSNDKQYLRSFFPYPQKSLVRHSFEAMKWICSPQIFFAITFLWQLLIIKTDFDVTKFSQAEFEALRTVLASLMLPSEEEEENYELLYNTKSFQYLSQLVANSFVPKVIMGLHLIREELALNVLCKNDVQSLGRFLSFATTRMNWPLTWRLYYGTDALTGLECQPLAGVFAHPLDEPPSIMKSLYSVTENSHLPATPFISFSRLIEMDSQIDRLITPQTYKILRLYEMVRAPNYSEEFLLEILTNLKIEREDIELYPIGILNPLRKMLKRIENTLAQVDSSVNLSVISRQDLDRYASAIKQLTLDVDPSSFMNIKASRTPYRVSKHDIFPRPKDIYTILADVIRSTRQFNVEKGMIDGTIPDLDDFDEGHTLKTNAALIFGQDRRFNYALSLLIYYKPHSVQFFSVQTGYRKLLKQKKEVAKILSIRTCLSGLGFGAVAYSTEKPLATQKWIRPELNFTYLFPDGTKISMDSNELNKEILNWGEFHGGVSAGLRISRKAKGINGSWIAFNKPKVLDAQHGGFLLGLGLNGHLKNLEEWHVYNYLSPKKTHVSIGLLLGMSASMKGTMDLKLTKVLSVHIVALLPPGSSDLNINLKVQTAGIVGIGLLYQMSQHRRMSEVLFGQLKSFVTINDEPVCDESYRLSAGISLGLINLGAGNNDNGSINILDKDPNLEIEDTLDYGAVNSTLPDGKITNGLLQILTHSYDSEQDWIPENSQISATVALMLIFLKTKNLVTASSIKPDLQTMHMNYRPEIFMFRELAFHMIMWDTIGENLEYLLEDLDDQIEPKVTTDNLPVYYLIGGRALAMGIKYASTGSQAMRDVLLSLIDRFLPFYQYPGNKRLDFRLTIAGINVLVNVLLLSVSMIMCGTGDLQLFRRIRYLHEIVSGKHSDLFKVYKGGKKTERKRDVTEEDRSIRIEDESAELQSELEELEGSVAEEQENSDPEEQSSSSLGEISEHTGDEFVDPASDIDDKKENEDHYAKFIASTMSLGFLFLGSGQYALKTSDKESLAYLIISVLPLSMSTSPLQETKYFWSMSVEPRCLMFRDAETEKPINGVPFYLTAYFNSSFPEVKEFKAPCLLPDMRKIKSIKVQDPKYYPLEVNFQDKLEASDFFKNGTIIYIKPRPCNDKMANSQDSLLGTTADIQVALRNSMQQSESEIKLNQYPERVPGPGAKLCDSFGLRNASMIELQGIADEKDAFTNNMRIFDLDMLCSDENNGDVTDFQLELWRKKHCA